MIAQEQLKYDVHLFLSKRNIMHSFMGVYVFNNFLDTLVYKLHGTFTYDELQILMLISMVKKYNVLSSSDDNVTYLEILF